MSFTHRFGGGYPLEPSEDCPKCFENIDNCKCPLCECCGDFVEECHCTQVEKEKYNAQENARLEKQAKQYDEAYSDWSKDIADKS